MMVSFSEPLARPRRVRETVPGRHCSGGTSEFRNTGRESLLDSLGANYRLQSCDASLVVLSPDQIAAYTDSVGVENLIA